MILREIKTRNGVVFKLYSFGGFEKIVQQLRKKIDGVPGHFTLDACRHGGMTELEEAALTEGQGRALSGHKTAQAYRGYAKEPSTAHCRPRASVTRTGLRTKRRQTFGMKGGLAFGMKFQKQKPTGLNSGSQTRNIG
jgi:hypothetical protein